MALTPESIAQTWANDGTVQVETAEDYNVLITYLNANPTAATMRNAELIDDIDYQNGAITFTFFSQLISNFTLDGNGHTIKKIVANNVTNWFPYVFFWGDNGTTIKNLKIINCSIGHQATATLFQAGTIQNVQISDSRITVVSGYRGIQNAITIERYSSAITVMITGTGDYYGINILAGTIQYCAIIDTVYRTNVGGEAVALWLQRGTHTVIFTRNRFFNFSEVSGIKVHELATASMMYAAITAENATNIYPVGGQINYPLPTATYYDNVLVPNAAALTNAGLTTGELQSVATMTAKGFNVEAVN